MVLFAAAYRSSTRSKSSARPSAIVEVRRDLRADVDGTDVDIAEHVRSAPYGAVVIDTSNYYPMRDGSVREFEDGDSLAESWRHGQLLVAMNRDASTACV